MIALGAGGCGFTSHQKQQGFCLVNPQAIDSHDLQAVGLTICVKKSPGSWKLQKKSRADGDCPDRILGNLLEKLAQAFVVPMLPGICSEALSGVGRG